MIETERLILRKFEKKDLNDLYEYISKISINCFASLKAKNLKEAKRFLKERIKARPFYFAIELKEEHKVIGEIWGSLNPVEPEFEHKDTYDLCWMLNPSYEHHGYMFEAAKAFFDFLFNEQHARRIFGYIEDYNVGCQKVAEKLGMRREAYYKEFVSFVNDENGNPIMENTYEYAILSKEWNNK